MFAVTDSGQLVFLCFIPFLDRNALHFSGRLEPDASATSAGKTPDFNCLWGNFSLSPPKFLTGLVILFTQVYPTIDASEFLADLAGSLSKTGR